MWTLPRGEEEILVNMLTLTLAVPLTSQRAHRGAEA